jgi:5'-methylthioadenosine phosphorylase
MEGPQFSTRAESNLYREWNADIIGMTNFQEAKLAREAEICYATLALSTDYDCWHDEHDVVSTDQILEVLHQNVTNAQKIMVEAVKNYKSVDCKCRKALQHAILTDPKKISVKLKQKLKPIIGDYIK